MMKTVCRVAMAIVFLSMTVPAMAATKVFLLAGQSNMVGRGVTLDLLLPRYAQDLRYHAAQPAVKFWDGTNHATGWADLAPGFGYTGSGTSMFGPEVSFGYAMHNAFPNDNIYLVKYAVGATALALTWKPTAPAGSDYIGFTTATNAALRNLRNAGLSPTVAGMIWMQGESDAKSHKYAAQYRTNLKNFIGQVRRDFGAPNMPFIVGRILVLWGHTPADAAAVRGAEQTVPGLVGHSSWINTDDLQISPTAAGHYGTQGQIDLGTRFAGQFLGTAKE